MKPEKRFYKTGEQQSTTEVSLYSTPKEDLYTVFTARPTTDAGIEIKAHVNPLVWWVWFGSAVMVFGTMVTLLPDRRGAFTTPQASLGRTPALEESMKLK